MQSYFKGERYSRFHCLIFAEQNESGKLEDCALYSKRDVVSFFRAHLQHGSDSHKDLRSESVNRKMNMLSRYSDEDTSVALVFADGLNFVETPFFTYSNEARSRSSFDFTTHETLLEKYKSETKSLSHYSCQ